MAQRVTQSGALVAYVPDETKQRVTQVGVLVAYIPDETKQRVTQTGVLVAYQSAGQIVTPGSRPVIWID